MSDLEPVATNTIPSGAKWTKHPRRKWSIEEMMVAVQAEALRRDASAIVADRSGGSLAPTFATEADALYAAAALLEFLAPLEAEFRAWCAERMRKGKRK